ncbi:hypothetical protein [Pseudorhodoferax sp. Leaf267]|uniref:hypothetical protein n=1 Tax=Pseudorhodoferax sp. Leaf267 TaxID=1736316 RepID=UPI0006F6A264|nr:hypothetical protein [Pseudorhodoferax sp. Leaf267]KQP18358.1 hypothetical protein ASF43_11140 [Pseudorhodoferax sp. Leaf267]
MFDFLRRSPAEHLKRADTLLREAHMARIDHQAAAEHHAALAEMYAQRAARLEREIYAARAVAWPVAADAPAEIEESKVRPFSQPDRIDRR